ncbi:MAG: lipid asymmetry maintenance protein MlaB [Leptothrix sp. (in: b-proteobacteria)]
MTCLLPVRLTEHEARETLQGLCLRLTSLPAGQAAEIDAGELQQFDSTALAVLLELRRTALAHGHAFSVLHAPARLRELARLYGVADWC